MISWKHRINVQYAVKASSIWSHNFAIWIERLKVSQCQLSSEILKPWCPATIAMRKVLSNIIGLESNVQSAIPIIQPNYRFSQKRMKMMTFLRQFFLLSSQSFHLRHRLEPSFFRNHVVACLYLMVHGFDDIHQMLSPYPPKLKEARHISQRMRFLSAWGDQFLQCE